MKICVISPSFPTKSSISFMFVEQLCRQFADLGHDVIVITKQSIIKSIVRGVSIEPLYSEIYTSKGNLIKVYRPYTLSAGMRFFGLSLSFAALSTKWMLNRLNLEPDIMYCHFWESAYAALGYAKLRNIPLFSVAGEDYIILDKYISERKVESLKKYTLGTICVSTKSKDESIEKKLAYPDRCVVIPNAIDPLLFYKRDKIELRKKYNISNSDIVLAFVGQFTNRKGVNRVCRALDLISDSRIKAIFIGSGSEKPTYQHCLYSGKVEHNILPEYLSLSDFFVLPTLSEGCCNAIIEAMACGLPIISSNMPFNWDVLNENNSVMINPESIEEIAEAIKCLAYDIDKREKLSEGALNTARNLTLDMRAKKIIQFIYNCLG